MVENGAEGKPRKIYFSYKGVDVDVANNEILIERRWYHASQIKHWESSPRFGVAVDVYLEDPDLPVFYWKAFWDATQTKMIEALRIIRP